MITKPVAAIERIREWIDKYPASAMKNEREVLAYLDSIPDDAVPVVWPKELTRERLEELAATSAYRPHYEALCAIAAIAPVRKKRVVNLWQDMKGRLEVHDPEWMPYADQMTGWRCFARNVELED